MTGTEPAPCSRPPKVALRLLNLLVPRLEREFFLGDLEQAFHERGSRDGPRAARRWFWRQALAAIPAFRSRSVPPRKPAIQPSRPGDSPVRILQQDLRYAVRTLARTPGFSLLAILILALGIGATTAIFSVVNPVLFQPLPFPHPEQLVMIWEREKDGTSDNTSFATFSDLVRDTKTLDGIAVMSYWTTTLTGLAEPERLGAQRVSSRFFGVLGVRPELGRDFLPSEDAQGTNHVVILSHGLWQRRFGNDRGIIGKPIDLGGVSYTVVGVMPANFESVLAPEAQIWGPLGYNATLPYACRTCRHLRAVARLKDGVSQEAASRELNQISLNLVRQYPRDYSAPGMVVASLQEDLTRAVRPALLAVLGAVLLVLGIAGANVTSLQLGRAVQRESEFAVRSALGAGRNRVARQIITESGLLGAIGGLAGLALAYIGTKLLPSLSPQNFPRLSAIRLDGEVLGFATGVSLTVGIIAGLAPALIASRNNLRGRLSAATKSSSARGRRIARGSLVVGEVALALMLLVGAGLLLESLGRLLAVDPGFEPRNLLTMQIETAGPRYRADSAVGAFYHRVLDAVRVIPGVTSAAVTSQLPLGGDFDGYGVHREGVASSNPENDPGADRYSVSADYLATMRIPIFRGRGFTEQDVTGGGPPVVLINRTFAERTWAGENPIGRRVSIGGIGPEVPWRTIVGVVGDVHHTGLDAPQSNQIYLPEGQPFENNGMVLTVRTSLDPNSVSASVRRAIWSVDKDQPVTRVASMDRIIAASTAQRRFALVLFELFGVVALVLAAAGIYGVIAGSVTEHTREIGIRTALGASRANILGLVVRQGLALTLGGAIIGTGGALVLSRLLTTLLYGVGARDPLTFITVVMLLCLVALAACCLPAWRATRVDPVVALRSE